MKGMQQWLRDSGTRALATGLGLALQAWGRTVDTRIADYEPNSDTCTTDFTRPALYILWHENIFLPLATRRGADMTLLVGMHRDANWLGEIVDSFGFKSVRGSSSKGGIQAILKYMRQHKQTSLVLTPDGPRGPRRVLSAGCIQLASLLKMPLIPVGIGYHAPYRNRSWDRFAVPRLGTRGRMILGPPMVIPRKMDTAMLEQYRSHVESIMQTLSAEAESWAFDGLPRENERGLYSAPHASIEKTFSLGILE